MNPYQTFWRRFGAGMVDGLVFLPLVPLQLYLSKPERSPAVLISWAVAVNAVGLLYSILLHARYGQTLGKRACGVIVYDISEQRLPSLRQAFLRDIGLVLLNTASVIYFAYLVLSHKYIKGNEDIRGLPGTIMMWADEIWFWLEVLTMLANSKRRALHDLIARTVVVRKDLTPALL